MEFNYEEYAEQCENAQKQAWQNFLLEIERLQAEYNTTKTEIIDGLSVTRSKFYSFEKTPEEGLNIDRHNVLKLWAYLCDTESRRVPKAAKALRASLKEEGPDKLLAALGFATRAESKKTGPVSQKPQIRRVVKRLESNWIFDDAARVYITDNILDQVLDLGQPNREFHRDTVELSAVEDWPKEKIDSKEAIPNRKYKQAIQALIRSGKTEFVPSELFELYQSILEHHELGEGRKAKLRILDCQFRALSKSLSKFAEKVQPLPKYSDSSGSAKGRKENQESIDFETLSKKAERDLVKLLVQNNSGYKLKPSSEEKEDVLISTPCLEAEIRCQILIDDEVKLAPIRYRSTSTHVENMLRAMSHGLGYPLEISGFSIRATGQTEKSLARISIGLSKKDENNSSETQNGKEKRIEKVHQGWWVSSNTITGVLSATADAVHRWVNSEKEIDEEKYYRACLEAATISQEFYALRKALYEYTPHAIGNDQSDTFDDKAKRIINDISQYINEYDRFDNDGFKLQRQKMRNQKDMTRLVQAHAALISGDPEDAGEILSDIRSSSLIEESNPYSYVLSTYRKACEMAYLFISGNEEFTIGKHWKQGNQLKTRMEELGHYIRETKNISFDVYLVISQLYGTVGILDFYSVPSANDTTLSGYKKSTDYLIQAAHYSLRIGHVRRAAQWLSFASRMRVRLGSVHSAKVLHQLSVSINDHSGSLAIDQTFPLHMSGAKSNWSEVGYLLAEGEIRLLRQDNKAALDSFLKALNTAMLVGYGRVMSDCLYNISRAAEKLSESKGDAPIEGIDNPFCKRWDENDLNTWEKEFKNPKLSEIVAALVEEYLRGKRSQEIKLSELADEAKSQAAAIWQLWKPGSDEHPCAKHIRDSSFLAALHE